MPILHNTNRIKSIHYKSGGVTRVFTAQTLRFQHEQPAADPCHLKVTVSAVGTQNYSKDIITSCNICGASSKFNVVEGNMSFDIIINKDSINFQSKFYYLSSINFGDLDPGNFSPETPKNCSQMFNNNPKFTSLNLSKWHLNNVSSYTQAFTYCDELRYLYLDHFKPPVTDNKANQMFYGISNLYKIRTNAAFRDYLISTMPWNSLPEKFKDPESSSWEIIDD